jgi:hypothetical protein
MYIKLGENQINSSEMAAQHVTEIQYGGVHLEVSL